MMSIFEIIEQFEDIISIPEIIICLVGLVLLACWLLRASMGIGALFDSAPRRNNMPLYFPFIPFFIWYGIVSLAISVTGWLLPDLSDWQAAFRDNLILCIGSILTIAVIIFLVRISFARRLKGFGLDIKTIHRDFFAAVVNLVSIWPLMVAAVLLTMFFGKLILGPDFNLEQHEELKTIATYPQLSLRILVIIAAVVVGPVLEEMLFRGLFQTAIRTFLETRNPRFSAADSATPIGGHLTVETRTGIWLAIFASSALFAVMHKSAGHWPALFMLGLCLGYSYEKSGSLLRPIFIHCFFNAFTITMVLLASAQP
jgi:membrane protease YdiL (CAAX protease family)